MCQHNKTLLINKPNRHIVYVLIVLLLINIFYFPSPLQILLDIFYLLLFFSYPNLTLSKIKILIVYLLILIISLSYSPTSSLFHNLPSPFIYFIHFIPTSPFSPPLISSFPNNSIIFSLHTHSLFSTITHSLSTSIFTLIYSTCLLSYILKPIHPPYLTTFTLVPIYLFPRDIPS